MRRMLTQGDIMPTSFVLLSNPRPCGPLAAEPKKGFAGALIAGCSLRSWISLQRQGLKTVYVSIDAPHGRPTTNLSCSKPRKSMKTAKQFMRTATSNG
jgi:hypothetical protein